MQKQFKSLAQARELWHNETTATHQDLAGLFVARAVERYLKPGGHLGFVVPNSVIDRDYWSAFRKGRFDGAAVSFTRPWDLRRIRPHLFPRGSAVIFGTRTTKPSRMPSEALTWAGRAPHRHASIHSTSQLHQAVGQLNVGSDDDARSPYSTRFAQGANLVPRVMFRVEETAATALGLPVGRSSVRSKRSVSEKAPWKALPDMVGAVESQFVWPTILGEHVLPFRITEPDLFVVPLTRQAQVLTGDDPKLDGYPGLANWVRQAEGAWAEHGRSRLTLGQQIDHMRKLTQQVPQPAVRVVYAASGMHVSAALLTDPRVLVEHGVYWASVASETEGYYLTGILNSPSLTELVRPLMSYGKDERHVDKHVWKLPIPTFNNEDETHAAISRLARQLTDQTADHQLTTTSFVTNRRNLRAHLASDNTARELDDHVVRLLGGDPGEPAPTQAGQSDGRWLVPLTDDPVLPARAKLEVDVDCEFDTDGKVYLWGKRLHGELGGTSYSATGSKDTDFDEVALATEFVRELRHDLNEVGDDARWYHYGNTEPLHLRRLLGVNADDILARGVDLLSDVIRPNYYAPSGYGLKNLGPLAGASWRTPGADGSTTYRWIDQARAGDETAWERLVEYNEDDTIATAMLRDYLRHSRPELHGA